MPKEVDATTNLREGRGSSKADTENDCAGEECFGSLAWCAVRRAAKAPECQAVRSRSRCQLLFECISGPCVTMTGYTGESIGHDGTSARPVNREKTNSNGQNVRLDISERGLVLSSARRSESAQGIRQKYYSAVQYHSLTRF